MPIAPFLPRSKAGENLQKTSDKAVWILDCCTASYLQSKKNARRGSLTNANASKPVKQKYLQAQLTEAASRRLAGLRTAAKTKSCHSRNVDTSVRAQSSTHYSASGSSQCPWRPVEIHLQGTQRKQLSVTAPDSGCTRTLVLPRLGHRK